MTRKMRSGSTGSSSCSSLDEDPLAVSLQLLTDESSDGAARKAYQGMIDMLDDDLRVISISDKSDFQNLPESSAKISSETAVPCLATVLFFNGSQLTRKGSRGRKSLEKLHPFSKPDLLLNHMWNGHRELEHDFKSSLDLNENRSGSPYGQGKNHKKIRKYVRNDDPFLPYDAILKESLENQKYKDDINERDIGFRTEIFNFEVSERTLEARKQLETWPWEFHHKAQAKKGISQCHGNAQDFYAYQPDRDVTRLYGDVIDTTKIRKQKSLCGTKSKDNFVNGFKEELDGTLPEENKQPITTTDYPLMAVREIHYGRQHLRFTLFVSADAWTDQVEFYRLLLRRHDITLRDDFCFFTVYSGEDTDIQFALKKLGPKQRPIPLSSSLLQFKVLKVGHLVPLLPFCCQPITDTKWQTKDHDGNCVVLDICSTKGDGDTSRIGRVRSRLPLEGAVTPSTEAQQSTDENDDEYSLERLDSFVEPELPPGMPLFQNSLYNNLTVRSRFGSRTTTSSASPGSSSSTSPERRQRRFGAYGQRMFSGSSLELGSTCTLPNPRHSSTTGSWTSPRISESSDEPENTNFYRRAKSRKDTRRKSEGVVTPPVPKPRSKSSSRAVRQKQKTSSKRKSRTEEELIEVYV